MDVTTQAEDLIEGKVAVRTGDAIWTGTVLPQKTGVFASLGQHRIVGGGGGWGMMLPSKSYHNDAGVLALSVAEDAARAAEEIIGGFDPQVPRVGADYVRRAGVASAALDGVIGDRSWWVDRDGTTRVGAREPSDMAREDYDVMRFDPRERVADLVVDDLRKISIGSRFFVDDETEVEAHELRISISQDEFRVRVWCGGELNSHGRIVSALSSIAQRQNAHKIFGKWRYRVIAMSAERAQLQAVSPSSGLPDIIPVSLYHGVPGAQSTLAPSAIVLVEFIEGDPTMPIVTAFGSGTNPVELSFSATASLSLGSDSATEGVPLGTSLHAWLIAHQHAGVQTGGGVTGPPLPLPAPQPPLPSTKVKVAP